MSDLSSYRASIKRLVEASDTDEAFKSEGFDGRTACIVGGSKSFKASRSASQAIGNGQTKPCGGMPQGQTSKKLK